MVGMVLAHEERKTHEGSRIIDQGRL